MKNPYYTITPAGERMIDRTAVAKDMILFVAVPSYKECKSEFSQALTLLGEFLTANRIRHLVHFHRGDSVPDMARNMCVAEFLRRKDCNRMLWLDDDLYWPSPDVLLRYLALDQDVIGGNYPKKMLFWDKLWNAIVTTPELAQLPMRDGIRLLKNAAVEMTAKAKPGGRRIERLVEADRLPGGFTLVKRDVYEQIAAARPDIKYSLGNGDPINEHLFAFYRHVIKDGEWLGEDYYFSELARACGLTLWKDDETEIAHIGTYVYTGDPTR